VNDCCVSRLVKTITSISMKGGRRKDSGLGFTPEFEFGDSEGNTTPTSHPITRKKKPKRRSTGVVNLLEDESEQKSEESADEVGGPGSATPESPGRKGVKNGGEIDYKKVGAWVGRRQPLILSPHHYFSCGRNRKEKIIASRVRSLL